MRRLMMVVAAVAGLALGACDDGASCDMNPDQADCPDDDGYYDYPVPDPTPTPPPSQGVRVNGVNGMVYAGETVFVAVIDTEMYQQELLFCGAAHVGSAGDFSIAFESPQIRPGYFYRVNVLADLDDGGGLTGGEPQWHTWFDAPSATTVTSSDVAFDFASAESGSFGEWGVEACL